MASIVNASQPAPEEGGDKAALLRYQTVSTVAYALACAVPIVTALLVSRLVLATPFWDEWTWTDLLYKMHVGSLRFGDVWQPHAGQRMLFPNVIALSLDLLGGWSQLREVLFSLLLIVLTQAGMFIALRRVVRPPLLPFVFLGVTLLLYSFAQIENLDWGFQSAWFLCNACAVTVMLLLGTAGQSWFALLAAVGIAVIGSFSAAQGLLVWPAALVTLLFTERRRPAQILVWIAAGVVTVTLDQHGIGAGGGVDWSGAFDRPLAAAGYFGAFAGSALTGWLGAAVAVVVGWCVVASLVALIVFAANAYRRDRSGPARAATMVGLGVYGLCVGAVLTAQRVDAGVADALSSRYTSVGLYCWISAIVLAAMFVQRFYPVRRMRKFVLGTLVVLAILYAGSQVAGLRLGRDRVHAAGAARAALASGGGPELQAIYPDPSLLPHWLDELRAIGDGPYYHS